MRQWDQIELAAIATQLKRSTHDFVELLESEKLCDRQFADRDHEPWLQKIDLIIHPGRTILDLVGSGNAISARGGFSGKTTAHRREVNLRAHLHFIETAKFLEPTEEGAASRPGKGFAEDRFFYAGRLTDEDDFAENRAAGNWWRQHARTSPALEQMRDMCIQQLLPAR